MAQHEGAGDRLWPTSADPYAVLLGAGYSAWACGLPVAAQLFDLSVVAFGPREQERLRRVALAKQAWDQENAGGLAEQFIANTLATGGRAARDVLWYIGRRLSEGFILQETYAGRVRRHHYAIDDRRAPRPNAGFLRGAVGGNCAGVLTTNYDLLVEYALTTRGFNYGFRGEWLEGRGAHALRRPTPLRGRIAIAKLHGSLSWDAATKYTEGRRGITGDALIVAPTPEKQPPACLEWVWDLATAILEESSRLLVFGFAFNPYDQALLSLLRASGAGIRDVFLVDIKPSVQRAATVWPRARIATALPPPDGMTAIRRWLGA